MNRLAGVLRLAVRALARQHGVMPGSAGADGLAWGLTAQVRQGRRLRASAGCCDAASVRGHWTQGSLPDREDWPMWW